MGKKIQGTALHLGTARIIKYDNQDILAKGKIHEAGAVVKGNTESHGRKRIHFHKTMLFLSYLLVFKNCEVFTGELKR